MTESRVYCDAVEPGEKRRLSTEPVNRLERLDEGVLCQIRGVLAIRGHVIDDPVNALAIICDQAVKSRDITGLHLPDHFEIRISFLPALGRRHERLTENFGRFDHGHNEAKRSRRSKSKV